MAQRNIWEIKYNSRCSTRRAQDPIINGVRTPIGSVVSPVIHFIRPFLGGAAGTDRYFSSRCFEWFHTHLSDGKNDKHLSSEKNTMDYNKHIINHDKDPCETTSTISFCFFCSSPFTRLDIICSRPAKSLVVYWVIDVFVCTGIPIFNGVSWSP